MQANHTSTNDHHPPTANALQERPANQGCPAEGPKPEGPKSCRKLDLEPALGSVAEDGSSMHSTVFLLDWDDTVRILIRVHPHLSRSFSISALAVNR